MIPANDKWQQDRKQADIYAPRALKGNGGDAPLPLAYQNLLDRADRDGWEDDRRAYVFGNLDAAQADYIADRGYDWIWRAAYLGQAATGRADEMAKCEEEYYADVPGGWEVFDYLVNLDDAGKVNAAVMDRIAGDIEWGADTFIQAIDSLPADALRGVFHDRGVWTAAVKVLEAIYDDDDKSEEEANDIFYKLQQAMLDHGAEKASDTTLTTTEYMIVDENLAHITRLFNFATRRVKEIYKETADAAPAPTDAPFDEYPETLIEDMRKKLKNLGGHPPECGPRHVLKPADVHLKRP